MPWRLEPMNAGEFRSLVSGRTRGIGASLARFGLGLGAVPYRLAVAIRNWRFDHVPNATRRVSVPVISVGNLTVGGVGKTPFIVWLAKWFRSRGIRVCIVSRGYGAERGGLNDEALELEQQLPDVPHIQNPDRIAASRIAIEELETQLILLDDAFQHRRIHRDLDILVVDALEPFGYGHLLPRGLLREPISAVGRAQVAVLTRVDAVSAKERSQIWQQLDRYRSDLVHVESKHAPIGWLSSNGTVLPLAPPSFTADSAMGSEGVIAVGELQRVVAFCGIGNPAGFRHSLESSGAMIDAWREFPDHHRYSRADLDALDAWVRSHPRATSVVCTRKDLVKIQAATLGDKPLLALAIGIEIRSGLAALEAQLERILALAKPDYHDSGSNQESADDAPQ